MKSRSVMSIKVAKDKRPNTDHMTGPMVILAGRSMTALTPMYSKMAASMKAVIPIVQRNKSAMWAPSGPNRFFSSSGELLAAKVMSLLEEVARTKIKKTEKMVKREPNSPV